MGTFSLQPNEYQSDAGLHHKPESWWSPTGRQAPYDFLEKSTHPLWRVYFGKNRNGSAPLLRNHWAMFPNASNGTNLIIPPVLVIAIPLKGAIKKLIETMSHCSNPIESHQPNTQITLHKHKLRSGTVWISIISATPQDWDSNPESLERCLNRLTTRPSCSANWENN